MTGCTHCCGAMPYWPMYCACICCACICCACIWYACCIAIMAFGFTAGANEGMERPRLLGPAGGGGGGTPANEAGEPCAETAASCEYDVRILIAY